MGAGTAATSAIDGMRLASDERARRMVPRNLRVGVLGGRRARLRRRGGEQPEPEGRGHSLGEAPAHALSKV